MKEQMIRGLSALAIIGGASVAGHEAFAKSQPKPVEKKSFVQEVGAEITTIKSGNFSFDILGEHVVFTKKK